MNEKEMTNWVHKNCKFAAKKTASVLSLMNLDAIQNPHQAFQQLMTAYKKQSQLGPVSTQDIQMDLAQLDQRLGGNGVLNTPENVQALTKMVAPAQQPAPAPVAAPAAPKGPSPRYVPDPVEQYMNQPHLDKMKNRR